MKLRLVVGRYRTVVEFEVHDNDEPDVIAEEIYDKAIPHLRSADVEAFWDSKTRKGTVIAGFHTVGRVEVVE